MKKIIVVLVSIAVLFIAARFAGVISMGAPGVDQSSLREINQGKLVGFADEFDTHAWLGIPYAQAPVGDLRWRATRAAQPWSGVKEALAVKNYCTQIGNLSVTFNPSKQGEASGSEDCLFLNLWAPQFEVDAIARGDERLPVMVWIHGGGNTMGQAATYNLAKLAGSQKVIAVAINYRLGVFGWLSHPALRAVADNEKDRSSNFAVLDMIESLAWVKNNIAAFGGDPGNVTIFGESAGGRDVLALMASPLAKGLFHQVIAQSGATSTISIAQAENYADDTINGHRESSGELLLALLIDDKKAADRTAAKAILASMSEQHIADYLRSKAPGDILVHYEQFGMGMYDVPQMIRDAIVLPNKAIIDVFKQPGAFNAVPLITGSNRDEIKLFLMGQDEFVETRWGLIKEVRDSARYELFNRYRSDLWRVSAVDEVAQALSASGSDVWAYRFDWDEGGNSWIGDTAEVFGAAHSLEIPFVIGQFTGLTYPGIFTDESESTRSALSDQMMSYWAAFAYTGAPSRGRRDALIQWQPWNNTREQFMIFDSSNDGGIRMVQGALSYTDLKSRLSADTAIAELVDRCRLYVQMFARRPQWDQNEYLQIGCEAYPPSSFSVW
jgi:para-nitrobenzyl esterase